MGGWSPAPRSSRLLLLYLPTTHPPPHPPTQGDLHPDTNYTYALAALYIPPPLSPHPPTHIQPTAPRSNRLLLLYLPITHPSIHPPTHPPTHKGDLHPDTNYTYALAALYIPFAVCSVGNFVSTIAEYYVSGWVGGWVVE